jgi:hypothetical protein
MFPRKLKIIALREMIKMKKLILACVVFLFIVFGFAGCRADRSATSEEAASDVQSAVSEAAPKLVSDGKLLQSQASDVVSGSA